MSDLTETRAAQAEALRRAGFSEPFSLGGPFQVNELTWCTDGLCAKCAKGDA